MAPPITEGHVTVDGHRTWYRVTGDRVSGRVPLLVIHGGPGMPSDVLDPLDALGSTRAVVRYDQQGCGRSDRPGDPARWRMANFLAELTAVRTHLGLDRVHLFGVSWGGMLAQEYLLTRPTGVVSLTLASSLSDTQLWAAENQRLRQDLDPRLVEVMQRFEASYRRSTPRPQPFLPGLSATELRRRGRLIHFALKLASRPITQRAAGWAARVRPLRPLAYQVATVAFFRRHGCRLDPLPNQVSETIAGMNQSLYETMWGPSDVFPTGTLRTWSAEDRLDEIAVPTLLTSGRHDGATPAQMQRQLAALPDARWVCFEDSSHTAMLEEPERYRQVLGAFLDETEADRLGR